jgi:hypothetical protein
MTKLHIYDKLKEHPVSLETDISRVSEMISSVRSSNPKKAMEIYTMIYVIIIHHHYVTTGIVPSTPPYGMIRNIGGKGVIINVNSSFPVDLLDIIHRYLDECISTS